MRTPNGVKTWLAELKSSGEFSGKSSESAVLYNPPGCAAKRLLVVGAGKREKFDGAALRRIVAATVRVWKQKGVKSLAWILTASETTAAMSEV